MRCLKLKNSWRALEDSIIELHEAEATWSDACWLAMLMAIVEKRGVNPSKLRGSIINDPILNHAADLLAADFTDMMTVMKERQLNIPVVGGGLIPEEDKAFLESIGVEGNYGPGTPLQKIIDLIAKTVAR